jgi:hypothetical protein
MTSVPVHPQEPDLSQLSPERLPLPDPEPEVTPEPDPDRELEPA